MANRQDFKRLEDGGKAGVFVGVLAAGAALGKKLLNLTASSAEVSFSLYIV